MALPFVVLFLCLLGALLQLTLIATAIRRGSLITTLLVTFGVSLILKDLIVLGIGADIQTLKSNWLLGTFRIGDIVIDGARGSGLLASLILLGALAAMLKKSKAGRAIRATAQQSKIGKATCRKGVWQYVENSGVGVSLKKKKKE